MYVSENKCKELRAALENSSKTYCRGLYLSARWFVLCELAKSGMHLVVLPDKEAAEYCCSDLYNIIE